MDTRGSICFEFLKNQSRNNDIEYVGVNFVYEYWNWDNAKRRRKREKTVSIDIEYKSLGTAARLMADQLEFDVAYSRLGPQLVALNRPAKSYRFRPTWILTPNETDTDRDFSRAFPKHVGLEFLGTFEVNSTLSWLKVEGPMETHARVRLLLDLANASEKGIQLPTKTVLKSRQKTITKKWDTQQTDSGRIKKALDEIVIPKASFLGTRVTIFYEFLTSQSKRYNPNGRGVAFIVRGLGEADRRSHEFEVTIDADDVSLISLVEAICFQTGTKYEIKDDHVLITKGQLLQKKEFKADASKLVTTFTDDTKDDISMRLRNRLEVFGVTYPVSAGLHASVTYDRKTKTLTSVNTPRNQERIKIIIETCAQ